jgi:hypothetical protein
MNYIELLTGLAPDGGNGASELSFVLGLLLLLAVLASRRFRSA